MNLQKCTQINTHTYTYTKQNHLPDPKTYIFRNTFKLLLYINTFIKS